MLVRQKGVEQFSLREAARRAGVDPAMVYRQFEDKEDLLRAVAIQAFETLAIVMQSATALAAAEPDPLPAQIGALGWTYVNFALEHPTEFRIMFARRWSDSPAIPTVFAPLEGLLAQLAADGRLHGPPAEVRTLCWSAIHGAAMLLVDGGLDGTPGVAATEVVGTVINQLISAIVVPAPPGEEPTDPGIQWGGL